MKKTYGQGVFAGYVGGLLTAMAVAVVIFAVTGGFGLAARLHGAHLGMVEEMESIEVKQGFPELAERYSLVNDDGEKVFVPVFQGVEHCTYDWSGLEVKNNYKYYMPGGKQKCKIGIDVSKYQTQIDWAKVKESGVQFVMIRAGYRGYGKSGQIVPDEMFENHIQGAIDAGLDVGVYFFSQAIDEDEALEEAEYVIDLIKDYKITYPVAFDTEKVDNDDGRANSLSVEERTKIAKVFLDKVEKEGYEPMVYANDRWFALSLDLRELTDYKLWLASYRDTPVFPYQMDVWQHTSKAAVPGVSGNVDMNIWFEE